MKNRCQSLAVALVAALSAQTAWAQSCSLLADINNVGSAVSSLGMDEASVLCNGVTYFTATTLASGRELWRTTGVPGSTQLVADVAPGMLGSDPQEFVCHAGFVYFSADDGTHGRELWRTDGTATGTTLVLDINPGSFSSVPKEFLSLGSWLYFAAGTNADGDELWRTDGTPAGTQQLLDISVGPASSQPRDLVTAPGGAGFVFHAKVVGVGDELFVSDGTAVGTQPVFSGAVPQPFISPTSLAASGNLIFFAATTPATGYELWSTDGTPAGTQMVLEINPGTAGAFFNGNPEIVDLNGVAYFGAISPGIQEELWRSDGTALGTMLVADVNPGGWSAEPRELTVFGNDLVFVADNKTFGAQLFKVDTALGTTQLMFPPPPGSSDPKYLAVSGNLLYFSYRSNSGGAEPYSSDGATLHLLADLSSALFGSFPTMFTPTASGGVVFSAHEESIGRELYASSGTAATTALLADIEPTVQTLSSEPRELTSIGGSTLFFHANNGLNFGGPYRWDPAGGLVQLADIFNSNGYQTISSQSRNFTQVWLDGKSRVLFDAASDQAGREPWITDGTPAGTQLLLDIAPSGPFGVESSNPADYTSAFGKVFFSAFDGSDRELWVSDGTAVGTFELKDIAAGPGVSGNPTDFVRLGDWLLFSATDASGDRELWRTDGTPVGTQRFVDIGAGYSSAPRELTRVAGQVAFIVDRAAPQTGTELWKTDGTAAGTQLVSNLDAASASGPVEGLTDLDGELYFVGKSGGTGLWRSDLTGLGTSLVKSFPTGFVFWQLVPANGKLFFGFAELHVSDGTAAGTFALTSPPLGVGISRPRWITPAAGGVFFAPAYVNQDEDRELYFTDGTVLGTSVVCDLEPGSASSDPTDLVLLDGDVVFAANVATSVGDELWRLAPAGAYVADLGISGTGHVIHATQPLLGTTAVIRGEGGPAAQLSFLGLGAPLPAPTAQLVAPGSAAWLNPLTALILHVSATPTWSFAIAIPASPSLAGLQFAVQSWTPGAITPFPASTSNGLLFVLGS